MEDKRCIVNSIKGWQFSETDIADAIRGEKMLNPSIDLTNSCNLNCPYCYIETKDSTKKVRKPNELSLEETLKIIDELVSAGAKTINIVGAGEPTIDPHFKEVVSHIFQKGLTTVLFTNGIKLATDDTLVDFLYEKDVSLIVKLNSRDSLVQDLLAGKRGYSKERDKALARLIEKGFNQGKVTRLGVDTLALNDNYDELIEIHKECRKNNIFPIIADYIPTGRTEGGIFVGYNAVGNIYNEKSEIIEAIKHLIPITNGRRKDLLKDIESIDKSFNVNRDDHIAYYGGGKCTQQLGLYIDIEGNIYPCVARKIINNHKKYDGKLGNYRAGDSITDIWNNHDYIKIVRKEYNGGCPYKPQLKFI